MDSGPIVMMTLHRIILHKIRNETAIEVEDCMCYTSVNNTVKLMTHTCHAESILFFITKLIYPTHYRKQFSTDMQIIM